MMDPLDPWFAAPVERHRATSAVMVDETVCHLPDVPDLIAAVVRTEIDRRNQHREHEEHEEDTMSFDWSQFGGSGAPFAKWDEVGHQVVGEVIAIRTVEFEPGRVTPVVDIQTADGPVSVTIDKVDLRRKVAEAAPQVGDRIRIRYAGNERRERGTMKVFEVAVKAAPTPPPDEEPF